MFTPFALALLIGAAPPAAPAEGIPLYTHALAQAREPRSFPFTAVYAAGERSLVFVAAMHESGDASATAAAIRRAFDTARPALVVLEGFPNRMGENPPAIVSIATSRGTPGANPFAASEGMLAASLAIEHGIRFVGAEPTDPEQVAALQRKGFAPGDVFFADLLKVFPQYLRSGQLSGPSDPGFAAVFDQVSQILAHNRGAAPMTLAEFNSRYRATFGVEPAADPAFARRADPSAPGSVGSILAAEGQVRDEALFAVIAQGLETYRRVLVVYGGSHWTTLSQTLERHFGRPNIL